MTMRQCVGDVVGVVCESSLLTFLVQGLIKHCPDILEPESGRSLDSSGHSFALSPDITTHCPGNLLSGCSYMMLGHILFLFDSISLNEWDQKANRTKLTCFTRQYLMEFNSTRGDLMELSPLFSDDSRVAEAASIAQKLRSFAEEDVGRHGIGVQTNTGNATARRGLEVAVGNLQDYCNELENRLLQKFDAASRRRELSTMAECAKILSQFNKGTGAMQHYVATRPMFIDVEVMNADNRLVLDEQGSQASPANVARGLSSLYKEIAETVRKESATIMAVFPSPNDVMAILVQRVLEQRVTALLDKLLQKPSLLNPPSLEDGGLLKYLRMFAVAYEKTQELAKDLRAVGCGDMDVEDG